MNDRNLSAQTGVTFLRGYYAILDCQTSDHGEGLLLRATRLLAARPCMLQVRAKALSARDLAALVRAVQPLARAAQVPLCVNDRVDVALAVGADAVHLGQDDLALEDARQITGGRLLVGVSTHDDAQAGAAVAAGADYLGFGPVFTTTTKANPDPTVGIVGLRRVTAAVGIPVVAIGGITLDNASQVAASGAAAAAMIAAIETAADPTEAGRAVNAAFQAAFGATLAR